MELKKKYFIKKYWQNGSSMIEVILAVALVLAVTPFLYSQISDMTEMVQDIHYAKKIVGMRNNVITFVRVNESDWDKMDEIPEVKPEELKEIAPGAKNMIIDNQGGKTGTIDVYLVFPKRETSARTAKVVKYIGHDAAVVQPGGIAYAQNWAVQDDSFKDGELIFKISRDYALENKENYLHREGDLASMATDLYMNSNYMYFVSEMSGNHIDMKNSNATKVRYLVPKERGEFLDITADNIEFLAGLNLQNAPEVYVGSVSGVNTLYGFDIQAAKVNESKKPLVMGNSVKVNTDLIVGGDFKLSYITGDSELPIKFMDTAGLSTGVIKATDLIFKAEEGSVEKSSFGITVAADLWPLSGSVDGLTLGDRDRGPGQRGFWNMSADGDIMLFNDITLYSQPLPDVIEINPELLK